MKTHTQAIVKHLKAMKEFGRMEDYAYEMFLTLKDIAGGSYSEERILEMAQEIVNRIQADDTDE